jgi:hypothetical protein
MVDITTQPLDQTQQLTLVVEAVVVLAVLVMADQAALALSLSAT